MTITIYHDVTRLVIKILRIHFRSVIDGTLDTTVQSALVPANQLTTLGNAHECLF